MGATAGTGGAHRRKGAVLAAVVLAAGLTLGGCGAAGGHSNSSAGGKAAVAPQAADGGAARNAAGSDAAPGGTGTAGKAGTGTKVTPNAPTGRSIIYTGEIQLRTRGSGGADGVDAAVASAEQLVSAAGGFIDSEVAGSDGLLPEPYADQAPIGDTGVGSAASRPLPQPDAVGGESAQLVLRIPVDSYDRVYQQLLKLGTVLAHQRQAQDVTQQVVDTSSRVKTQQASVARVRALMDRAQSIADITALEQDLTQRQADLESLESQLAALQSQTAMSTVTLQLYSKAVPPPAAGSKSGGLSVLGALKDGWHALYETVRALLIALAASLPFLVPLAVLAWLVRLLLRRRTVPAPERQPLLQEPEPED
ncbi:DUF4349 domain-containing protein [Streptacidiphilus sp. N1-3]|uniref:DUF4349 domain-containing protein n=1 Tax=Streptacidiphilus alkalitolerans TaxID=3342712 RepID=A0ABV6X923_9ACTN